MKYLTFFFALTVICSFVSAAEYDKIITEMNNIINAHPGYVQMIDIGKNDQGNTIYGLKIDNPNYLLTDRAKTPQLYVGAHHGNERASSSLAITFAKKLVASLEDTGCAEYTALSSSVFYIIPVLNIGGYNANSRYESSKSGSSIDPNRDYPDVCQSNKYFQLASTQHLAYFIEQYNITGAVTGHGYVGTFTYPWGMYTNNTHTLDHSFYDQVGKQCIKANGYSTGTHADVIYPATGSFEDWAYYKFGTWTFLLELRSSSTDLEKDSSCLLTFYSLVPTTRSTQHTHNPSDCRANLDERSNAESRP